MCVQLTNVGLGRDERPLGHRKNEMRMRSGLGAAEEVAGEEGYVGGAFG
jgi:hypothetical protein